MAAARSHLRFRSVLTMSLANRTSTSCFFKSATAIPVAAAAFERLYILGEASIGSPEPGLSEALLSY